MKRRGRRFTKTILLFILSLLFVGAGGGVSLYFWNKAQKTLLATNSAHEIIYPTLYSDKHITENAILSLPRFKEVASLKREGFLANVLSALQITAWEPKEGGPERGSWLWTPTLQITPSYRDSIISGAKRNGIKNIYLSIDSYLDIYVLPDGPEKNAKKKAFDATLEAFIREARENDITVDAEAGWRNWAEPGHEYKAFAVLEYAIEFNKTHEEKLRGFQFDVEPYLLDLYKRDKVSVLHRFVSLIQDSVAVLRESDLELSVVIPEFYDGAQGETPIYFYGLRPGSTFDHLLNVLERRPGSKILVMAYRNFAEGENGTIDIAKTEIERASSYKTKVIVAQEFGDVPPPYITFHNTSKAQFNEQVAMIEKAFRDKESYGGVAFHYINALMALE